MSRGSSIDRNYQAEYDMETIKRAEEIKSDPGRVAAAKKYAADQAKKLEEFAKSKGPRKPAGF